MHVSSIKRDLLKHFSLSGKRKGLFETDLIIFRLKSAYTIYVKESQRCHQIAFNGLLNFLELYFMDTSENPTWIHTYMNWENQINGKKRCINSFPHKMKLNLSFRNVKFTFITFEILLQYNA